MKYSLSFCFLIMALTFFGQEKINPTPIEIQKKPALSPARMEVIISPNPATDQCAINGIEGSICTVFSSTGTYIGKWVIDNNKKLILTDLPAGILTIIIEKDDQMIVKRIVVI
jgi:hypothetical protein